MQYSLRVRVTYNKQCQIQITFKIKMSLYKVQIDPTYTCFRKDVGQS